MQPQDEKRASRRIQLEVPVHMGEPIGTTRDISGNGIYFVTARSIALNEQISFSVELDYIIPDKPLNLNCQGRVVRVEIIGDQLGVAAQIDRFSCRH